MPTCRLLPDAFADGAHHMAADETMLETAAAGVASLRFYGWSEATLSLGYFQAAALRRQDERLVHLPYVRRPTGGATLVHERELTYALALPAGEPWQDERPWLGRMHGILAAALAELGVTARAHAPVGDEPFVGMLCFHHFSAGDLLIGGAKVVGSAQRKQRRALLQHGAILLAASPHAPSLPGVRELTGRELTPEEMSAAVLRAFRQETGWSVVPGEWTATEQRQSAARVREKYTQEGWNCKR